MVRTAGHIAGMVSEARLPDRVTQRALAVFRALAEAEGRLHRRPPEQVHFHEVGSVDAIIDVVGTCAALELLEVDAVHASSVATGTGMVRTAHGLLPNPAPAVVELLAGGATHGLDISVELTTPTGAAILAATCSGWGPMPAMRIECTGFGAGSRELDGRPNVTQVVLGEPLAAQQPGQPVVVLEANVDDATGETLAHAIAALLDAGAHDAWITPIVMKKGRPAHTVSALCEPSIAEHIAAAADRRDRLPRRARRHDRALAGGARRPMSSRSKGFRCGSRCRRGASRSSTTTRPASHACRHRPLRDVLSLAEEAARRRDPDDEPA